ncbi:MAG: fumarylacetoacetate hydrolase family protein [Pseudomonadota bacterium]
MRSDAELVDLIATAEERAQPLPPLTDEIGAASRGYNVQSGLIERALADGRRLAGRKIGLTSKIVQEQLGVHEPIHGPIFVDRVLPTGSVLPWSEMIAPKVEPELAFTFRHDVIDSGLSQSELAEHIAHVRPAIEVVDSRIKDWGFGLPDMIADYAVGRFVVLSEMSLDARSLDLASLGVTAFRNDENVGHGTGAACLGHPLTALQWLVEQRITDGEPMRAGDLVITGSMTPVLPLEQGDVYRCVFDHLGEVSFSTR